MQAIINAIYFSRAHLFTRDALKVLLSMFMWINILFFGKYIWILVGFQTFYYLFGAFSQLSKICHFQQGSKKKWFWKSMGNDIVLTYYTMVTILSVNVLTCFTINYIDKRRWSTFFSFREVIDCDVTKTFVWQMFLSLLCKLKKSPIFFLFVKYSKTWF